MLNDREITKVSTHERITALEKKVKQLEAEIEALKRGRRNQ
jgi:polyhydroxyalkanoate synthesis regulator phasin